MKPEDRLAAALTVVFGYGILSIWISSAWAYASFCIAVYLISAVWLVCVAKGAAGFRVTPAAVLLAGAAAWGPLQLLCGRSVYAWQTREASWIWLVNACAVWLTISTATDVQQLGRTLRRFLYFGFALSVVSTFQMFTSHGKVFWIFPSGYPDNVLGPFVNRNQYAAFIELLLPIALYRTLRKPGQRFAAYAMAAVMAGSVLASGSRAGAILVMAEVILVPLFAVRRGMLAPRRALFHLAGVLGALAACTLIFGLNALWGRFNGPDLEPEGFRGKLLASSVQMIRDRPLMGSGLGTWATIYPAYALLDAGATVNQAHDDWAQWAAEGGLPFAAMLLGLALFLVHPALRSVWGTGVLVVLLHCLVDYPLHQRPAFAAFFFGFCGLVLAAGAARKPVNGTTWSRYRSSQVRQTR